MRRFVHARLLATLVFACLMFSLNMAAFSGVASAAHSAGSRAHYTSRSPEVVINVCVVFPVWGNQAVLRFHGHRVVPGLLDRWLIQSFSPLAQGKDSSHHSSHHGGNGNGNGNYNGGNGNGNHSSKGKGNYSGGNGSGNGGNGGNGNGNGNSGFCNGNGNYSGGNGNFNGNGNR